MRDGAFPEDWRLPIAEPISDFVDWLVVNYGDAFEAFANAILQILVLVDGGLRALPWWLVILLVAAFAFHASRRISVTIGVAVGMLIIGLLGLWDLAMQTLALMLVAVALAVLIGLPTGIAMAASRPVRLALNPVLDAMQTLPAFVYLVPAFMLFGLGKVPAILATVVYAVPPLVRLTDLGLRLVDREVLEAADAFGASAWQKLTGVQIPLALPTIMQGINQTIMLALGMVVIASMIGAAGLGQEVLLGIQRLDVGRGVTAGIGIVILAIILDRITQAYGTRLNAMRGAAAGERA